ncbi:NADH:ubiquinone oxidoreductase subunit NDUFA12 [Marivibrio halodurans]|uniref:NADH:ubiquinone oxidoreductase subunit NDUFA12 n=1 Tax=Marivibrio halodurans TaxID=2039722 RepID=A0A8J7V121_9PROT|nr:NADH:ubiquinone oxidoreductase subunit NDUFA12 [Marivibrio halodurans]MBP5857356.1 NADH:ubiquinone oxidoreductase subunit NDUFA12 [Marivibrio halodurans]
MPNAITRVITWLNGDYVGEDAYGNRYYQAKSAAAKGRRRRRWVIYSDDPKSPVDRDEASRVPPMYHAWLHYTLADFPNESTIARRPWQKEHQPNLTGTPLAYRPPGHTLRGGQRDRATGDYEAWTPE